MGRVKVVVTFLVVWVSLIVVLRAETIGTVPLNYIDSYDAPGNVFIFSGSPLFTSEGKAISFEFLGAREGFKSTMTPLLFEKVGTEYIVRGVGVPHATTGEATSQSGVFTLLAGSDRVSNSYTLGYIDATVRSSKGGKVSIESHNAASVTVHAGAGPWVCTDSRKEGATAFPIATISPGTVFSTATVEAANLQDGSPAHPYRLFTGRINEMNLTAENADKTHLDARVVK